MSILGAVGSLYMAILIILLIIGFGLIGLKIVNYVLTIDKIDANLKSNKQPLKDNKSETHKWLRIALYSFIGVMLSVIVLSILNSNGSLASHM